MTTKILFWIDRGLYQYGIAKYIQKNIPCEVSVIYEVNSQLKKIFQEQEFVKFQKEWYFWDETKLNSKPDFDYLKTIEKKYNINLWLWAYNDRLLYGYNQLYKFSYEEILSITEKTCKFYEKILEELKPDYLIIKNTDSYRTHLLKLMCNAKNIKTLMIVNSRFTGRMSIREDILHMITNNKINTTNEIKFDLDTIRNKHHPSKRQSQIKLLANVPIKHRVIPALDWLTSSLNDNDKKMYTRYGISKLSVLKIQLLTFFRKNHRKKFIDKKFSLTIDPNQKFVYYALHVQPERTISIDSPFYNNQIDIIRNIAKSIPSNFLVYVKEHPTQVAYAWHPISYYEQIMSLPNVILIHPSVDSEELIKKSSLVTTIGGTVGLECGYFNKHCITFTDTEFSHLSHVHLIKNIEELPDVIRNSLDKEVDKKEIESFYEKTYNNSIGIDEVELDKSINNTFFRGTWTMRNDISPNQVYQYFEDNQTTYEKIAQEFIKVIELTKNKI